MISLQGDNHVDQRLPWALLTGTMISLEPPSYPRSEWPFDDSMGRDPFDCTRHWSFDYRSLTSLSGFGDALSFSLLILCHLGFDFHLAIEFVFGDTLVSR